MKNRSKRLLSDIATFSISNFASKLLVFLMVPLYTHVLAAEEYGIADLITSTLNILTPLLTLAIAQATMRFLLDKDGDKGKVLGVSLVFGFLGLVLLILGTPIGKRLSPELGEYWGYFLAIYLLSALNECQSSYIRGIDKIRLFAIKGILHTAITVTLNIVFLLVLRTGVKGYLLAIILSDILVILFGVIASKMWTIFSKIRFDWNTAKEMLKYSIPMIPTIIAWWVMSTSDKYVLIAYAGLAVSGIYSMSCKIPGIMTIVVSIFNQAWQISAVQALDDADYNTYVKGVYKTFFALNILMCAGLIFTSELLGKILFAGEYFTAWKYVPVLLVAYLFSGLSGGIQPIFTAKKRTFVLFCSTICGAALNLILNLIFIPQYGAMAAAVTTAIGFFTSFAMRDICVRKFFGISLNSKREIIMIALLIGQSLAMSIDWIGRYPLQIAILATIVYFYRKDASALIEKGRMMITKVIRRKKS